jgi:hypothetical protein
MSAAQRAGRGNLTRPQIAYARGGSQGDALDRLLRVRRILPAMGRELAAVRREAARLRLENSRLLTRVHELERDVLAEQRRG